MKSIDENGILRDVFNKNTQDEEIIVKWLLDGSPLPNETFQYSNHKQINIKSHEKFQFQT